MHTYAEPAAVDSPSEAAARRAAQRAAEDAEDAHHKRAASNVQWQRLGLTGQAPTRNLKDGILTGLGGTRWQDEAACRAAPAEDAEAFTEVRTQAEAEPLVSTYCSTCPVLLACLAEGRALKGWGVFGGVALVDGLKAAQGEQQLPRTGQSATPARAWLVAALADGPQRRVELVAAASEAGIGSRTLDSAARAHAVVSTRRPGDPGAWWGLPGDVNAEVIEVKIEPEAEPEVEPEAIEPEAEPEVEPEVEPEAIEPEAEPEVEPSAEAIEGAALWLIDWLSEHGPQPREDVLSMAPGGPASTVAGARLLDLDTDAETWCLP